MFICVGWEPVEDCIIDWEYLCVRGSRTCTYCCSYCTRSSSAYTASWTGTPGILIVYKWHVSVCSIFTSVQGFPQRIRFPRRLFEIYIIFYLNSRFLATLKVYFQCWRLDPLNCHILRSLLYSFFLLYNPVNEQV